MQCSSALDAPKQTALFLGVWTWGSRACIDLNALLHSRAWLAMFEGNKSTRTASSQAASKSSAALQCCSFLKSVQVSFSQGFDSAVGSA